MAQATILRKTEIPREARVPRTREEFCIGCGVCFRVCPMGIIAPIKEEVLPGVVMMKARTQEISTASSETRPLPEYCIGCRRCVEECPTGARTF